MIILVEQIILLTICIKYQKYKLFCNILDNTSDTSSSSCNSSTSNHDDNDHNDVCCILDCVHALLILHRDKFIDDNNSQLQKDIQDSCVKSLVKILKFYKVMFDF